MHHRLRKRSRRSTRGERGGEQWEDEKRWISLTGLVASKSNEAIASSRRWSHTGAFNLLTLTNIGVQQQDCFSFSSMTARSWPTSLISPMRPTWLKWSTNVVTSLKFVDCVVEAFQPQPFKPVPLPFDPPDRCPHLYFCSAPFHSERWPIHSKGLDVPSSVRHEKVNHFPVSDFSHSLDHLISQKKKITVSSIRFSFGEQIQLYFTALTEDSRQTKEICLHQTFVLVAKKEKRSSPKIPFLAIDRRSLRFLNRSNRSSIKTKKRAKWRTTIFSLVPHSLLSFRLYKSYWRVVDPRISNRPMPWSRVSSGKTRRKSRNSPTGRVN